MLHTLLSRRLQSRLHIVRSKLEAQALLSVRKSVTLFTRPLEILSVCLSLALYTVANWPSPRKSIFSYRSSFSSILLDVIIYYLDPRLFFLNKIESSVKHDLLRLLAEKQREVETDDIQNCYGRCNYDERSTVIASKFK